MKARATRKRRPATLIVTTIAALVLVAVGTGQQLLTSADIESTTEAVMNSLPPGATLGALNVGDEHHVRLEIVNLATGQRCLNVNVHDETAAADAQGHIFPLVHRRDLGVFLAERRHLVRTCDHLRVKVVSSMHGKTASFAVHLTAHGEVSSTTPAIYRT